MADKSSWLAARQLAQLLYLLVLGADCTLPAVPPDGLRVLALRVPS
ncbi:hypothetical protein [Nocardia iowensis]|uniref:Uncharacterized protein n=1 Tax=Nocardia iowensis TaxID=204891 RepID=A0ABX8RU35_NOCIO|nr:hypothetical protein [Nocardia iowensis]QXN92786.1 hypothetical protein KV110_06575 [Nocardia iowensis]